MRVWDVSPRMLCRQHLLGEHREIHAILSVLTNGKEGYSHHPETLRWQGKEPALVERHSCVVSEMEERGYDHDSPCPAPAGRGSQDELLISREEQMSLLAAKDCPCPLEDQADLVCS